jgi:hypothetical protein
MDAKKIFKNIAWIMSGEPSLKPSEFPNPIQSKTYSVISLNEISKGLEKTISKIDTSPSTKNDIVLSVTWKPKEPNFALVGGELCISKHLTPRGEAQVSHYSSLQEAMNTGAKILGNNPYLYVIIEDPIEHTNTILFTQMRN